jgi:pimeloyl-ACP methyl ester carboxylesterase
MDEARQDAQRPQGSAIRDGGWRIPVVFVPGGVMPVELSYGPLLSEIKDEVIPVLKDLEVYAADTPPADYDLGLEVAGIKRAADEAGLGTFHLVGYSGGGAASIAFTAKYPGRLRSLALIEPAWAGNKDWTPEEVAYWQEIDRIMALPPSERMRGFMLLNTGSGQAAPPPSGRQPEWMAKRPAGLDAMTRAFRRYDLDLNALRSFEMPVYLAVGGLSHPVEPRKAERLAGLFPNIHVETYQDRHHFDPPQRAEAARLARSLRELWSRAERELAEAA